MEPDLQDGNVKKTMRISRENVRKRIWMNIRDLIVVMREGIQRKF